MPTLSQLDYIVAVDRLRNFSKAAHACHISQPSLSMQIQKAERQVGFAIFDRLQKPVQPTERGRRFIDQAKAVLREHERLLSLRRSPRDNVSGTLRLGVIPTLSPYLVPRFLEPFAAAYPEVDLRIDERPTALLLRGLQEDALDAGLAATPLGEPGLSEVRLFLEPFWLYAHPGHELLQKTRLRTQDLNRTPLWLMADGHCFRTQVTRLCGVRGSRQVFSSVSFDGGTVETLRQLVKQSRGATLVPDLFVRTLGVDERRDCVRGFVPPAPSREISLVFRRGHWKSDLRQALEKVIRAQIPMDLKESHPAQRRVVEL